MYYTSTTYLNRTFLPLIWKFNSFRTHEKFENYIIAQANWAQTNTYTIHQIYLWSVSHPIILENRLDFLFSDTISYVIWLLFSYETKTI